MRPINCVPAFAAIFLPWMHVGGIAQAQERLRERRRHASRSTRTSRTRRVKHNPFAYFQSVQEGNSFSLLRSMEGAFRLPCLNHACAGNVSVISDLFSGEKGGW